MPKLDQSTKHHDALINEFDSGRSMGKFSDLILVSADDEEFPAHKFVLSTRSSVFDRMFASDQFVEAKSNRVEIKDISSEVMKPFLAYLYTGDATLVENFVLELFEAAHKVRWIVLNIWAL